jgi:tRNA(Ile)-lysidine synthase
MNLLKAFQEYIKKEQLFTACEPLLLAVSGGADSVVLAHLCHQCGFQFSIAHCNFQLRGEESLRDEAFVQSLGTQYQAPVLVKRFDTKTYAAQHKMGTQEAARELRYEWFNQILNGEETVAGQPAPRRLLTAHHANDQVETVMMNFFKGTGIAGLRGMLPKQQRVVRPLLFAKRADIEQYIAGQQLDFVEDSSNATDHYSRNFLRNTVLPLVKEKFPQVEENIAGAAQRYREMEFLYNEMMEQKRKKLVEMKGREMHIPVLKLLKEEAVHTLVHEIIKPLGFTPGQVGDVVQLLRAQSGKYVQSPTHRVLHNRNWLIISPLEVANSQHIVIETADKEVAFANGFLQITNLEVTDIAAISTEPHTALLNAAEIEFPLLLRPAKPGDYFYPLGMKKKKKLARFLIDLKLSKTEKERVWVLESNRKIIWVVGLRIDERVKVTAGTKKTIQFLLKPATI